MNKQKNHSIPKNPNSGANQDNGDLKKRQAAWDDLEEEVQFQGSTYRQRLKKTGQLVAEQEERKKKLASEKTPSNTERDSDLAPEYIEQEDPKPELPNLTAVNMHVGLSAERQARILAEARLNKDLQTGNAFSRMLKGVWHGNIMRAYYIRKNFDTAYNQIKRKQAGKDVKELSDADWTVYDKPTVDRIVNSTVNGYESLLHKAAGEQIYKTNKEATSLAKEIISKYASGQIASEEDFNKQMNQVREMLRGDTEHKEKNDIVRDNYLEIANAVKGSVEHGKSVEDIMKNFKLVNAEVRSGIRTEVHRNMLDKIVNKLENFPVLNLIPGTVIAAAVSFGYASSKFGTQSAVKAATAGLGGSLFTGAVAASQEGNRVSADRNQRLSEMAMGISNTGETRYDKEIENTAYRMEKASKLIDSIKNGDKNALLRAQALITYSDTTSKDFIAYSSPEKIEEERYLLDLAIAEAKSKMTPEEKRQSRVELDKIEKELDKDVTAKDAAFKKLRHKRMFAMGAKTALIGAGTMIAGQEITAAFNPNSYGVFDKIFNLKNNASPKSTMLANLLGFKPSVPQLGDAAEQLTSAQKTNIERGVKLTPEEAEALENDPNVTLISKSNTVMEQQNITKDISEITNEQQLVNRIAYANNNTIKFDGNELGQHLNPEGNGFFTTYEQFSSAGNNNIDVLQAVQDGKIKMFITLGEGGSSRPVEVLGQVLPNGQISFVPEPGSAAAKCFEDGKFIGKFAEIAFSNGEVDGVEQIIPISTVVGKGLSGAIEVTQEIPRTEVVYDIFRSISGDDILNSGEEIVSGATKISSFPPIPLAGRKNLTYSDSNPNQESLSENEPPAHVEKEDDSENEPPAHVEKEDGSEDEQSSGSNPNDNQTSTQTTPPQPSRGANPNQSSDSNANKKNRNNTNPSEKFIADHRGTIIDYLNSINLYSDELKQTFIDIINIEDLEERLVKIKELPKGDRTKYVAFMKHMKKNIATGNNNSPASKAESGQTPPQSSTNASPNQPLSGYDKVLDQIVNQNYDQKLIERGNNINQYMATNPGKLSADDQSTYRTIADTWEESDRVKTVAALPPDKRRFYIENIEPDLDRHFGGR